MITENVSTFKIHKLTQEQYESALAAGNLDENALYLTPDQSGATFTPSVDEDGNLSWTNDKGLENPATVNIKGDDAKVPYTYSTTDLEAGVSELETGKLHFVYE